MRFLFLNQYFPPDPAPTGILLRQIGDRLAAEGHEVEYVSAAQSYGDKARGGRRAIREASALLGILKRGIAARHADVVFSATSPPCLLLIAALVAKRHGARSVHWAMDLYPELAETLGEVPPVVARVVELLAGHAYRTADLVVALDSDMVSRLRKYGIEAETVRPWILDGDTISPSDLATPSSADPTWLYSGNLGRAHEWETLLEVQLLLEKRGTNAVLAFQGSGPSREPAQRRARELGLVRCEWRDYAPDGQLISSLLAARVLVATQRPETKGMLWPSKLALLQRLPRPILWVGPVDGAVAGELRKRQGSGVFAPADAEAIADWLEKAISENFCNPASAPLKLDREAGIQWWKERLLE